jgi:hypothetical protein
MSDRSLIRRVASRALTVACLATSSALAAGAGALAGGTAAGATASQITQYTESFSYTGTVQPVTVPLGVSSVTITADGGSGGAAGPVAIIGGTPGLGASVTAVVPITGRTTLSLYVGQQGSAGTTGGEGVGGSSSGALTAGGNGSLGDPENSDQDNGGGGGGASVVDVGNTPLIVAGGGGGAGAGDFYFANLAYGGSGGDAGATPDTGGYGGGTYGGPGGPGGGAATGTGQSAFDVVPGTTGGGAGGEGGGYANGGNAGAPGFGLPGGGGGGGAGDSYAASNVNDVVYGSAPAGNGSITVSWSMPVVRLLTSATSITLHGKIKLTAMVEGVGIPQPTGSVTFYDTANKTTTVLGTVTLELVGKVPEATLTTTDLPAGPNRLYFSYGGDGNYPAAHSQATAVMVNDPKAKVAPTNVAFGDTSLGFTAWRQVVITSAGATPLHVKSIQTESAGNFGVAQNNCFVVTFAPGESCTILFSFDPQTPGPASGTADIETSASSKPIVVSLSGTGE